MPDQLDIAQLQEIGWEVSLTAVSHALDTHPMLVSCQLCLTHRVVNAPEKLHILRDASN